MAGWTFLTNCEPELLTWEAVSCSTVLRQLCQTLEVAQPLHPPNRVPSSDICTPWTTSTDSSRS